MFLSHSNANPGSERWTAILLPILLLIPIYMAVGWAGIQLTYSDGRIAAVWLPNALLIAVILRTRHSWAWLYIVVGFASSLAINLMVGDPWSTALILASANGIEVTLMVALVRWLCGPNPEIDVPRNLNTMLGIAVIVPIVSSLVPGFALAVNPANFSVPNAFKWYSAHALAMATLAPVIMIVIDSWRRRYWPTGKELREWVLLVLGTGLATAAIFGQSSYPFLFLVCPLVLIAAFRTGMLGTAVSIAIISAIASAATLTENGPIMLVQGDLAYKFATLQLFLATCFVIGLPVATVLRERERIGLELYESRKLSDQVLDNIDQVIFKTDEQGRWLFLNTAWARMTGYSVEESIGGLTTELLVSEDELAAQLTYAKISSGKIEAETLLQRFMTRDGELRHIEVTVRRLLDEDGRFSGTIGHIRDITHRVLRERALAQSESRFQALADLAPVGIFRTDTAGGCNYVNEAWQNMTGQHAEEWAGYGWADAMHSEDVDRVVREWDEAVAEMRDYSGEFRWVHSDGRVTWVTVLGRPALDADGDLEGFIGVTVDITDRRAAQAELAHRERELATLADNATDAVMRLSLDGICLYASPSSGVLFGLPSKQLVGENMMTGFHPEDREAVLAAYAVLASGEQDVTIMAFRAQNPFGRGDYIWLEANCGLVRDEATGQPSEIVVSIRDIGRTKKLEAELRDARTTAEEAVRAKSAFLANMSHEIRTPMNGVIGFTELVLGGDLNPNQRHNIELIAESGRAMMQLLNDILDTAKIEAGQMSLHQEPVHLAHKLPSTCRLVHAIAEAKGVEISVHVMPDVPKWVLGDPLRLRQILLNLIGNAVKFTEEGEVSVSASVRSSPGGDRLAISVKDSGIGIEPSRLKQIFDQFSQADSGIARKFGGTGLGLSISNELARMMGGSISVESEFGKGSTFTLDIPLQLSEPPTEGTDNPPVYQGPALRPVQTGRVLVAEDHDINQELMRQVAQRSGFEIEIAADGQEAVEMVEGAFASGHPYALVLMDMQMPRLDGLSATRKLRTLGHDAASLPIVALTANAFAEDIEACLAAGMQSHLAKPLRARDFIAAVRRWGGAAAAPSESGSQLPKKSLQDRYSERKQDAIEALSTALLEDAITDATVEELASILHKIAGTAGFFGEEALGEQARELEGELKNAPPASRAELVTGAVAMLR